MSMKDTKSKILPLYKKRLLQHGRFFYFLLAPLFFVVLLQVPATAQVRKYTDSFREKRSLYFTWDSKITFISNRYAQVKSIKLGFDFGGKTKFGLGYNWYKGNIVRDFERPPQNPFMTANLKFRYASLFTEYQYFINERWEATIPAQVGLGIVQYNKEFTKEKVSRAGGFFVLYEPSSTITYRFLRYFGVGLGIGYRLVILMGENPHKENFQSPVIMVRTKLYFDYLMQDVKKLLSRKKAGK